MADETRLARMERARQNWETLLEGNARFINGEHGQHPYRPKELNQLATEKQTPLAAILACSDSRITPEIVFDQPLGSVFSSRVPGNCVADSARWAIEMAVTDMDVPLVVVMGHTGCLAIAQIIQGLTGNGGYLRHAIAVAVDKARAQNPDDLWRQSIIENSKIAAHQIHETLAGVRSAVEEGRAAIVSALYDMPTGRIETLDWISADHGSHPRG